ncbi:MAG: hypothetical protein CL746_05175 [Chloroflexi bacterium]|nr:hypothetical protein [Chloroflexota bacterium]
MVQNLRNIKYLWFLSSIISLSGLAVTTYLTVLSVGQIEASCGIQGCNEVLNSKWAKILGIPISFPGMLFYGIILILSLNNSSSKNFLSRKIILIAIFLAVVASVYLTYIEIFIIKAICQYCVGSAILILINSITIISIYKKENLFKSFRIWQVLLLEDEAKASPNPQTQK